MALLKGCFAHKPIHNISKKYLNLSFDFLLFLINMKFEKRLFHIVRNKSRCRYLLEITLHTKYKKIKKGVSCILLGNHFKPNSPLFYKYHKLGGMFFILPTPTLLSQKIRRSGQDIFFYKNIEGWGRKGFSGHKAKYRTHQIQLS